MGEVVPFPGMPKRENKKDPAPEAEDLLFRISEETQNFFEEMLKGITVSDREKNEAKLAEQKEFVRELSDEEVIQFVENKENRPMLANDPALLIAYYKRIIGDEKGL